jgi:hypothetical protein
MGTTDFRHTSAAETAAALDSEADIRVKDLRAAIANAMERIASLEHDRDELEQLLKVFNEQMDAAKLYGPGLMSEQ